MNVCPGLFAGGTGALVSADTNALKSAAAVNDATRCFICRTFASRRFCARGIVASRGAASWGRAGSLHVCSTSERLTIAAEPDTPSGGRPPASAGGGRLGRAGGSRAPDLFFLIFFYACFGCVRLITPLHFNLLSFPCAEAGRQPRMRLQPRHYRSVAQ